MSDTHCVWGSGEYLQILLGTWLNSSGIICQQFSDPTEHFGPYTCIRTASLQTTGLWKTISFCWRPQQYNIERLVEYWIRVIVGCKVCYRKNEIIYEHLIYETKTLDRTSKFASNKAYGAENKICTLCLDSMPLLLWLVLKPLTVYFRSN